MAITAQIRDENGVALDDGWTVETMDRRPSAHFEHTVAMPPDGPRVLTCLDD